MLLTLVITLGLIASINTFNAISNSLREANRLVIIKEDDNRRIHESILECLGELKALAKQNKQCMHDSPRKRENRKNFSCKRKSRITSESSSDDSSSSEESSSSDSSSESESTSSVKANENGNLVNVVPNENALPNIPFARNIWNIAARHIAMCYTLTDLARNEFYMRSGMSNYAIRARRRDNTTKIRHLVDIIHKRVSDTISCNTLKQFIIFLRYCKMNDIAVLPFWLYFNEEDKMYYFVKNINGTSLPKYDVEVFLSCSFEDGPFVCDMGPYN